VSGWMCFSASRIYKKMLKNSPRLRVKKNIKCKKSTLVKGGDPPFLGGFLCITSGRTHLNQKEEEAGMNLVKSTYLIS
jgi:hypothetical protein